MIKSVEEALDILGDFYDAFYSGDTTNPWKNISEETIKNRDDAIKFLYDMEKELNEYKHYDSINGQLEAFNKLNK